MSRDILAIDVGTTALKLAVFSPELEERCEATRRYDVNVYCGGRADIEPAKWWRALEECCAEIREHLGAVGVVVGGGRDCLSALAGASDLAARYRVARPDGARNEARQTQRAKKIRQAGLTPQSCKSLLTTLSAPTEQAAASRHSVRAPR